MSSMNTPVAVALRPSANCYLSLIQGLSCGEQEREGRRLSDSAGFRTLLAAYGLAYGLRVEACG